MKNKKLVTLALATALTVSAMTPAFANPVLISEAPAADPAIVAQEEQAMQFARAFGTVQEVNTEENYVWYVLRRMISVSILMKTPG